MAETPKDTIHDLLVRNVPRELVLAIEDALTVGAERAFNSASGMHKGHLPHAVGQLRHFNMNETFHQALDVGGASPSQVQGNKIVVGRTGIFRLGRFNVPAGIWNNSRRSKTRLQLASANRAIEPLVQPGLFTSYQPAAEATVFFVALFSGSMQVQPEKPLSIEIAVPDHEMRSWLFREPLASFVARYEAAQSQADLAVPKLKKGVGKTGTSGKTE